MKLYLYWQWALWSNLVINSSKQLNLNDNSIPQKSLNYLSLLKVIIVLHCMKQHDLGGTSDLLGLFRMLRQKPLKWHFTHVTHISLTLSRIILNCWCKFCDTLITLLRPHAFLHLLVSYLMSVRQYCYKHEPFAKKFGIYEACLERITGPVLVHVAFWTRIALCSLYLLAFLVQLVCTKLPIWFGFISQTDLLQPFPTSLSSPVADLSLCSPTSLHQITSVWKKGDSVLICRQI